MQKSIVLAAVGVALALAACSKAEQQDTAADVKSAAAEAGDKVEAAVTSPEVKEVGSEIKEAAGDAGQVIKETARGAAEGAREGAAKVEAEDNEPKK